MISHSAFSRVLAVSILKSEGGICGISVGCCRFFFLLRATWHISIRDYSVAMPIIRLLGVALVNSQLCNLDTVPSVLWTVSNLPHSSTTGYTHKQRSAKSMPYACLSSG